MTDPVTHLLAFFEYDHLPPALARVSRRYHALAYELANDDSLGGPELTVALRKLLESKDCAVRSAIRASDD